MEFLHPFKEMTILKYGQAYFLEADLLVSTFKEQWHKIN